MLPNNQKSKFLIALSHRVIALAILFFLLTHHKAEALDNFNKSEGSPPSIGINKTDPEIRMTPVNTNSIQDSIFTKVDQEAEFRGGPNRWAKHIQDILNQRIRDFADRDFGVCRVKFIVDIDGKVSDISVLAMKGTKLADAVAYAIGRGPKWVPAMNEGVKVKAYREITVTMRNPG